jgi:hypothetical protein
MAPLENNSAWMTFKNALKKANRHPGSGTALVQSKRQPLPTTLGQDILEINKVIGTQKKRVQNVQSKSFEML